MEEPENEAPQVAHQEALPIPADRPEDRLSISKAQLRIDQPNRRDPQRHHEVHYRWVPNPEFCYLSLLGFAAPFIFLFSFLANIIFMRLLKYKLLYLYQRPTPKNARTLGSFNFFIEFIGTASIIVNAIVFGITLMGFDDISKIETYQNERKLSNLFNKK